MTTAPPRPTLYTTQLQAGLGLVEETRVLLDLWHPGMTSPMLHQAALSSGRFPNVTARRLLNVVSECFAPRYLKGNGPPAAHLKMLAGRIPRNELVQFFLLFTCRANAILEDFIRDIYWGRYAGGHSDLGTQDAERFIRRAIDDSKTQKRWEESTVRRVSAYLVDCCSDFGLLSNGPRSPRRIQPFHVASPMAAYLAYDLHQSGLGDNAVMAHADWGLFGLDALGARDEMKRLALKGILVFQAAADVVSISWKFKTMEELCSVLAEG